MDKFLTKNQRQELLHELKIERERKFADRIRVILLIDEGRTYKDIASFLFLDEKTILNWRKRYEEGGIEKLINDYYLGRSSFLKKEQVEALRQELEFKVYSTTQKTLLM